MFCDVIEDITDRQAIILNRNRGGSMILPGDTLLVCEVTPARDAIIAVLSEVGGRDHERP